VNRPIRTFAALAAGMALGALALGPTAASASTARLTTAPTGDCDVAAVKTRVTAAIDRRIITLDSLTSRTNEAAGLTDADRHTLLSQLAAEKNGLSGLKAHVAADTDCPSLRADAKSVVETYRVYLVMAPKVHLVIAADSITKITNSDKVADSEAKLQAGIDKKKNEGKDMTQAQADLNDMKAKVASARAAVASVSSSVINLQPTDYPGNRTTIVAGRDSVRAGRADLRSARADARAVIAILRSV
jgi:hypothetical protein